MSQQENEPNEPIHPQEGEAPAQPEPPQQPAQPAGAASDAAQQPTVPPPPHGASRASAAWQPQSQPQPQPQAAPAWGQPWPAYGQPAMYAPAPAPQKKSRAWIVALVAVVLVFALLAMAMQSCTSLFASSMGSTSQGTSLDALTQDAVAVIAIDGTIQYDGTASSPEGLKALLDEAEENPHVKAVVLRVDSGGGTSTAGEEMSGYVRDFSKPIVVSSASVNASAAYEISSQADYIYTAKSTSIGSIGVALQITDTSELMDMLGIRIENITSSDSKDSSYGNRALTDEERAYYQRMVDQINEDFIQTVAEGRGMGVEEVRSLATGLPFTGTDAVENGLADEIGTREDAIAKAAELAGISAYTVVDLQPESDDLYAMLDLLSENDISADDVAEVLKELEDGTVER